MFKYQAFSIWDTRETRGDQGVYILDTSQEYVDKRFAECWCENEKESVIVNMLVIGEVDDKGYVLREWVSKRTLDVWSEWIEQP